MNERLTFYERNIQSLIQKTKNDPSINESNRKAILDFHKTIQTQITKKGTTRKDGTRFKLIQDTHCLAKMLGKNTFQQINENEENFDSFLETIRSYPRWNANSRAQRCRSLVCLLKTVFKKNGEWLTNKRLGKIGFTPPLENQILALDEMLKLIEVSPTAKRKAVLSVLREGLRPAELLRLNVEDIGFDSEGRAIICVRGGKTGYRNVPTRRGYVFLKNWLTAHPKPENDIPFFPNRNLGRISGEYLVKINQSAIEKANLSSSRDTKLYNWRKSSITWSLRTGMTLLQASKFYGTSVQMLEATYGSVSQEELNTSADALSGMEMSPRAKPIMDLSKKCAKCSNENPSYEKNCSICGWDLTKELGSELMKKEIVNMVLEALVENGLNPRDQTVSDSKFKQLFEGLVRK